MSIIGKFLAHPKTVFFTGGRVDDTIVVSRDAAGHIIGNGGTIVISGGEPTVTNTNLIRAIGGAGNDTITLDEGNGPLPAARLFGGAGNDALSGGSGNDQLSGQAGDDILFGRAGNDVLYGGAGNDFVDGDQGTDIGFLGAGNDVFRWDPGDGSDRVEGEDGFDEMLFNGAAGAETFALSASGERALFTRVQGNIVMDLNEVEKVTVNALGGADTITINDTTGTDVREIDINLGAGGVGDTDTIVINDDDDVQVVVGQNGNLTILGVSGAVVNITGFEAANDQVIINGDLFFG